MALLKFLRPVDDSSSSPQVVNEVYTELRDTQLDKGKKQGVYQKLSSKENAAIGKYASEHGVASVADYITVSHDRYSKRIERIPHLS